MLANRNSLFDRKKPRKICNNNGERPSSQGRECDEIQMVETKIANGGTVPMGCQLITSTIVSGEHIEHQVIRRKNSLFS